MSGNPFYQFNLLDTHNISCLTSKERKEQMMQYNLDSNNLQFLKFRFTGAPPSTVSEYERILSDFLSEQFVLSAIGASGVPPSFPAEISYQPVLLTVKNMGFFDKLESSG